MIPVEAVWTSLARRRGDAVVVTAMTSLCHWPEYSTEPELDFPNTVMGKSSSVGLGLALARPERKVLVLDGDGSLLLNLGALVTTANAQPKNLVHLVFQNSVYEITGGQPVPGAERVNLAAIARGAGWGRTYEFSELDDWQAQADEVLGGEGPTFVVLHVTRAQTFRPFPERRTYHGYREVRAKLMGEGGEAAVR